MISRLFLLPAGICLGFAILLAMGSQMVPPLPKLITYHGLTIHRVPVFQGLTILALLFLGISIIPPLLPEKVRKWAWATGLIAVLGVISLYAYQNNKKITQQKQILAEAEKKAEWRKSDPAFFTITDSKKIIETLHHQATLKDATDLAHRRREIIRGIWKQDHLPTGTDNLTVGKNNPLPDNWTKAALKRSEELIINLPFGFTSKARYLVPKKENGRLMIYHQGHHPHGFMVGGQHFINRMLKAGYGILAFSMPATGENIVPEQIDVKGKTWHAPDTQSAAQIHHHFGGLKSDGFSPLRLFLEPVVTGLNYVLSQKDYQSVSMAGLSGGGWTTTVYAALDPRINHSYPIAGSLPLALAPVTPGGVTGDFEQSHSLFKKHGYLKLYAMAAVGSNRHSHQILNQFDPCCFNGLNATLYQKPLQSELEKLGAGNQFRLSILPITDHIISDSAIDLILSDERTTNP